MQSRPLRARLTRRALVIAGNSDALGDPGADLRLEPSDGARTQRPWLWKCALLDLQINGGARKAGAQLNLLATLKRGLALVGLRHGRYLVAVNGQHLCFQQSRASSVTLGLEQGTNSAWHGHMIVASRRKMSAAARISFM